MSRFELHHFEATPVAAAVAVVELGGRFTGPLPTRPRLLVETNGVEHELPAIEHGGSPWSAVFAIPLSSLGDPGAAFSLVPGRGPLVALPTPSSGGEDDRFVRLARTANDLRHRLGEATEEAAATAERLAETGDERDRLVAELGTARDQLAAAEARATEAHEAAVAAREEQARAEGEADAAREEGERSVEEARAQAARAEAEAREEVERVRAEAQASVQEELAQALAEAEAARAQLAELQDRVVAAEDDARAARLDIRDTRARMESLLRDARSARAAATHARVPSAGVEPEFHAARLGPEWADRSEEEPEDETEATAVLPAEEPPGADEGEPGDATAALGYDDTVAGDAPAGDAPDPTETLQATAPAGDAPTTASLEPVDPGSPRLWRDDSGESVRILRPRTSAGRLHPAPRPVDTDLDPATDEEEVLEPAAVGARMLQPAELTPQQRVMAVVTNPRVIVGAVFVTLILALILIFSGFGLV